MLKIKDAKLILTVFFMASFLAVSLSLVNYVVAHESYDLLIIGPRAYEQHMQKFIAFKHSLGVSSRYVSVEWINESFEAADLVWKIHNFVAREYECSGIKYLLLVGTYNEVPTRYVYSPSDEYGFADFNYKPTDWFYAVPDWQDSQVGLLGGNVPKLTVGRLPVKNSEELEQIISKTIYVETNSLDGLFLIFQDANLMSEPLIDFSFAFQAYSRNVSTDSFTRMLSSNAAFVVTFSHGSPYALWITTANNSYTPFFTVRDVDSLNETYGIHYMVSCFSGALDLEEESLARALIISKAGPILVIGNSRTESLSNPIPLIFWKSFLETGDVADSLLKAVTNYLNDPAIFNSKNPSFKKYNYFLCQVVYGDISWKFRNVENIERTRKPSTTDFFRIENSGIECKVSPVSTRIFLWAALCVFVGVLRKRIKKL